MPAATTQTETFGQRVHRLYAVLGRDAGTVTDKLLEELRLPDEAAGVLRSVIRNRVQHELRMLQSVELRAPGSRWALDRRGGTSLAHGPAVQIVRRAGPHPGTENPLWFLGLWVAIPGAPDGGRTYGRMTAEDHAARARKIKPTLEATAEIVRNAEWAAKVIADHGVECLSQIADSDLISELPDGGVQYV